MRLRSSDGRQRAHLVEQDGGVEAHGELVGDVAGTLVELGRPPRHADDHAVAEHLLGAAERHDGGAGGPLGVRCLDLQGHPLDVVAAVERAEQCRRARRRRSSIALPPVASRIAMSSSMASAALSRPRRPELASWWMRAIRWCAASYGAWRSGEVTGRP